MEKPNLPSPHNNYFQFALSHLPNARSLIESQLPAAALRELKLETLGIRFNLAFAVATLRTGYNGKGELTGYTYPDGTAVGRNYTARGELYQLSRAGTTIDTRVYDNGGPCPVRRDCPAPVYFADALCRVAANPFDAP